MSALAEFLAVLKTTKLAKRTGDRERKHPPPQELSLLSASGRTSSSEQHGGEYEPQRKITE